MEFVPGKKITDLSPLVRMDFDGAALAEDPFRAYLEQILVHGFFHADPHPGNVFITPDHRIALLDLGMVGRILPKLQEDLLQLLLAVAEGHGDEAANIAIKIGEKKKEFASKDFTRRIGDIVAQQKTAHGRTDADRPLSPGGNAGFGRERYPCSTGADPCSVRRC